MRVVWKGDQATLDCAKPGVWSAAGVVGCIVSPRSATDSREGRCRTGFTARECMHFTHLCLWLTASSAGLAPKYHLNVNCCLLGLGSDLGTAQLSKRTSNGLTACHSKRVLCSWWSESTRCVLLGYCPCVFQSRTSPLLFFPPLPSAMSRPYHPQKLSSASPPFSRRAAQQC